MKTSLQLLFLEDSEDDFLLVKRHLRKHLPGAKMERVGSLAELQERLGRGGYEVVLADYAVPGVTFEEVLGLLEPRREELPLILLSGAVGEERAVELLKQGVWDFVWKDGLARLAPVIERAMREVALRQARQAAARRQKLSTEVLEILNDRQTTGDAAKRILDAIRRELGVEAAAIRLREGNDFPYAVAEGFAAGFLEAENSLLARGPDGQFCLDERGEVRLECTCGLVICGRTDVRNPLFTQGGSAWTNNALPFLAVPAQADPRFHPRNRCIHDGFRSVALIPIRMAQEIVGLLQLNDRRPGYFTRETISYLEGLAASFGVALMRLKEEAKLRLSEERYRNLAETAADWIWEVDAQGRYVYASPKVFDLLGYTPEEVLGKTPFELMPPAEGQRVAAEFQKLASTRERFAGLENTNRHKQGHVVVMESSGVPVFGPGGEFKGYRGMDRNVTEQRRLQEQLRQAQKLEAVGQLAGGIAHDFNNILAAFGMNLDLLNMGVTLDAEAKSIMQELTDGAKRAAALTQQLLMFSRRSVLAVRVLDVNEAAGNLLKMLSRLIGENFRLVFEGKAGELPPVEADPSMFDQVLMNLVVNARDAMPKGGEITIQTSVAEFKEEEAVARPQRKAGQFVCLTVTDTGVGIDAAMLPRIFEPFFTTKEAGKGTGLGLATVYGVVAQHKGWVEVESVVGQGTTFRVFLPALSRAAAAGEPVAKETALQRGGESILLVEDEATMRESAGRGLRSLGYEVLEAGNGQEAVRLWQAHGTRVRLLLTDMVMPEGMTGLELAERLQSEKPELKVIISSGYSAEILQAGIPGKSGLTYLPKPYDLKVLAAAVRKCLDKGA